MKTVFILVRDNGYEGFSEPLAAFSERRFAEIFKAGADANYSSSMRIFELELQPRPQQPEANGGNG